MENTLFSQVYEVNSGDLLCPCTDCHIYHSYAWEPFFFSEAYLLSRLIDLAFDRGASGSSNEWLRLFFLIKCKTSLVYCYFLLRCCNDNNNKLTIIIILFKGSVNKPTKTQNLRSNLLLLPPVERPRMWLWSIMAYYFFLSLICHFLFFFFFFRKDGEENTEKCAVCGCVVLCVVRELERKDQRRGKAFCVM